jgi:hypothetical protein
VHPGRVQASEREFTRQPRLAACVAWANEATPGTAGVRLSVSTSLIGLGCENGVPDAAHSSNAPGKGRRHERECQPSVMTDRRLWAIWDTVALGVSEREQPYDCRQTMGAWLGCYFANWYLGPHRTYRVRSEGSWDYYTLLDS